MNVRLDELQEEPQGLQVGDGCAGYPDSEECRAKPCGEGALRGSGYPAVT